MPIHCNSQPYHVDILQCSTFHRTGDDDDDYINPEYVDDVKAKISDVFGPGKVEDVFKKIADLLRDEKMVCIQVSSAIFTCYKCKIWGMG